MHDRHRKFLQQVGAYLSTLPPLVKEEELREISSHLHQLSFDLQAEGHNEDTAAALTLARFGTARKVGLRLRDVWEGNRPLLLTLLVTIGSNLCLQVACGAAALRFLLVPMLDNEKMTEPLTPLLIAYVATSFLLIPLAWNFFLGKWGGRRAAIGALLSYLPWLFFAQVFSLSFNSGFVKAGPAFFALAPLVLAYAGAAGGSTVMRKRRLPGAEVLANAAPSQQALLPLPILWKTRENFLTALLSLFVFMLLWVGAWAWSNQRVQAALHPATPEAAVRVLLAAPSFNFNEMSPSTDVTVEALPAVTAEELAGSERAVYYEATMHATEDYLRRRTEYYQKLLRAGRKGRMRDYETRCIRSSLARLKPEGYRVSGILHVKSTHDGWQVNTSSGPQNQPWGWLFDMYYQEK